MKTITFSWWTGKKKKSSNKKLISFESDILKYLLIPIEWEKPIKKALRKSAKSLMRRDEKLSDIDPEDALLSIFSWYLNGRRKLIDEAEYRARKKVGKFWKIKQFDKALYEELNELVKKYYKGFNQK